MEVVGVVVEAQARIEAVAAGQNAAVEVAVQELVHRQTAQRQLRRSPMDPGEKLLQLLHGIIQLMEPSRHQLRLDGMRRPTLKAQLLHQVKVSSLRLRSRVRSAVGLVFLRNHHPRQRKLQVRLLVQRQRKPHRPL